jgi:hypothetical protein
MKTISMSYSPSTWRDISVYGRKAPVSHAADSVLHLTVALIGFVASSIFLAQFGRIIISQV